MGFVGPVVAVVPLAQTTEGGGGRRAINDGIEGKGGYLHNDWGKKKTFPRLLRICRDSGVYTTQNQNRNLLVNNSIKKERPFLMKNSILKRLVPDLANTIAIILEYLSAYT